MAFFFVALKKEGLLRIEGMSVVLEGMQKVRRTWKPYLFCIEKAPICVFLKRKRIPISVVEQVWSQRKGTKDSLFSVAFDS